MSDNSTPAAPTVADLLGELRAFREEFRAVLAPTKRIEPDAVYSISEAAELVPVGAQGLRRMMRAGILNARGGGRGSPWTIRGSELLKLGGNIKS
jgi:hypothetical protein